MKTDQAARLADVFEGPAPDPSSLVEKKIAGALLRELCIMGGFRESLYWLPEKYPSFEEKSRSWTQSGRTDVVKDLFPGAHSSFSSAFCGIDEINRSGVFKWECTDFVISVWTCDVLLNVAGGHAAVEQLYGTLKADGLTTVITGTRSPMAQMFDDPWTWDYVEERMLVDNAYYLYGVLTGHGFAGKVRREVGDGAEVAYLNSFLLQLLAETLGSSVIPRVRYPKWLLISDATVRCALTHAVQTYASLDGCSRYGSFCSAEAGAYLSPGRKRLSRDKERVLDRLFAVMVRGRQNGDLTGGGLSDSWNKCCSGIISDGRYLSSVVYDALHPRDYFWRQHASALFHFLVREWIMEK